jgi:peptidoglycan/LPS O-acetylase OafA/YrhL
VPDLLSALLAAAAAGDIGGTDCEELGDSILAQPVNAVTSGGYVVAALVLWLRIPRAERFRAGGLYALLLTLIGLGSMVYHGPQWPGARFMHDLPIPLLILMALLLAMLRYRRAEVLLPGRTRGRLVGLVAVSIVGLVAYALGRTGSPLCDPESFAQLHGLWHLCTAIGFAIIGEMLFRPAPDPEPA